MPFPLYELKNERAQSLNLAFKELFFSLQSNFLIS